MPQKMTPPPLPPAPGSIISTRIGVDPTDEGIRYAASNFYGAVDSSESTDKFIDQILMFGQVRSVIRESDLPKWIDNDSDDERRNFRIQVEHRHLFQKIIGNPFR